MESPAAAIARLSLFNDKPGEDGVRMLERADARARAALAKGGGDALLSTLMACFTDQMDTHSQSREFVSKALELLSDQKAAAARGGFAASYYPADFVEKAMGSLRAQPFRAKYTEERLAHYFPQPVTAAIPCQGQRQPAAASSDSGTASSSSWGQWQQCGSSSWGQWQQCGSSS